MINKPVEISAEEFQIKLAQLGIEAESFQRSHLGRYLYDRADEQIENNTRMLVACNPDDLETNRRLRNNIHVGESIKAWINEAIRSGQKAVYDMEESENID